MTAEEFLNGVLREFYRRMHGRAADNYDVARFSYDGVDRSQEVNLRQLATYMAFFTREYRAFFQTYNLLADEASKQLFLRLIMYRLAGHLRVRIKDDAGQTQEAALYAQAEGWLQGDSELPLGGAFGGLKAYRGVPYNGAQVDLDGWPGSIVYTYLKRQYLYERDGVRIRPETGDTVLDLGACLGDTTVAFATCVGPTGRVVAFDPLTAHVRAVRHNVAMNGREAVVTVVPRAVSDQANDLPDGVGHDGAVNPGFRIQQDAMPLTTIDAAAAGLDRVDFIKMDIEGAELLALKGGVETLRRHRPKLAISIYHRLEDYIALPLWLASTLPDYEFHLDHYTIHAEETVLFGRPRQAA